MKHRASRGIARWKLLLGLTAAAVGIGFVSYAAGRGTGQDRVLAVVGGQRITVGDVEGLNAGQFRQLERQRYDLLEQGLEEAIGRKLLEVEAESRGITADELWAKEVEGRVVEPSDHMVDSFYQARGIDVAKDSIAPRIRQFLKEEQRAGAARALFASLREKHSVKDFLEPERAAVEASGHPSKGPMDAPVTIVEFADFECPYCRQVLPSLARLQETYGDNVRLVFRQFPLNSIHRYAQKAAEAALCAHEQDRFWAMHDALFEEPPALRLEDLKEKAARVALDVQQFDECLDSGKYAAEVAADLDAARRLGLTGTPAFFINGRFLSGAQPYQTIANVVDDELRRAGY
ncbi:MAG TPA: thioredoxin domain-containing protein [Gemmatimonadales bacterium]|nr:thioredoxin domain-containing protein [Gemmatimonadales bacterium]